MDPWAPEDPWTWQDVSQPEVVLDGFEQPLGLSISDGVIWVADAASGRVSGVDASGTLLHEWETDASPKHIAAANDWVVFSSPDDVGRVAGYNRQTGAEQSLASGKNWGSVAYAQDRFWWHADAGTTLYSWQPGASAPNEQEFNGPILEITATPDGIMAVTGTNKPWAIRNDEGAVVAEIWEEPQDLVWANETLWLSTRSPRWPYPGWIYRLDGGAAKVVEYSPPEPGPITATPNYIYWGSKQTLTRATLGGEAYEAIALQTSVADVIADGDTVYWTDRQRGLLLIWED